VFSAPYEVRFSVDLLNAFNSQTIQVLDNNYTFDEVLPIPALCKANAAGKTSPGQVMQNSCPDLAFAKTSDGRPVTPNANYGKAASGVASYQTPLQVRFGLALAF
jgi:hypothetical protein